MNKALVLTILTGFAGLNSQAMQCKVTSVTGSFFQVSLQSPAVGETTTITLDQQFDRLEFADASGKVVADLTPNGPFLLKQSSEMSRTYLATSFNDYLTIQIGSADGVLNIAKITETPWSNQDGPATAELSLYCHN